MQSGEYDKNTVSIHAFNGNLPSENPNDYMNVYCTLSIGNRSVFNIYPIKAVVYELGDYKENVLFSLSSDAAVPGRAWRFSNSEVTFQLDVNVANMDESAIKDLVKGIKAKVIYKGDFITTVA